MTINVPSASCAPSTPRFTLNDSVDSENVKSCTYTHTHIHTHTHVDTHTHTHTQALRFTLKDSVDSENFKSDMCDCVCVCACVTQARVCVYTDTDTHLCACKHLHTSEATISILDRITKPEFRPSVAGNLFFGVLWCALCLICFLFVPFLSLKLWKE